MLEELGIKRRKSGDGIPEEAEADFDDDIGMLMPVTEDGEKVEIDETECWQEQIAKQAQRKA